MTVNIIKLSVGVDSVEHLAEFQAIRRAEAAARGEPPISRHLTRTMPRRRDEVLDGGSIYWVIRGAVQARQLIVDLADARNPQGEPRCAICLDKTLVRTAPRPHRAFQGWRYLKPEDAPPDLGDYAEIDVNMPREMMEELRELGLL